MARIRTIKPDFAQSESMGRVSRDARLTFIELWTIADDSGRLRGNSRMLASLLFPYDDDARELIDGWLEELEREGCIVRYRAGSDNFIEICNWLKHQKIDKPSASKLPPFGEDSTKAREDSPLEGKGREGKGEEGAAGAPTESLDCFLEAWNENRQALPALLKLGDDRKRKLRARIAKGMTLDSFTALVQRCTQSPFLCGKNREGWTATFDWLIENEKNSLKVLEGNYGKPVTPQPIRVLSALEKDRLERANA